MLYNILAIGDVVGGCGVSCLEHHLRAVKKLKNIHFTVVNGENAAMVGLTPNDAERIFSAGADVITLGNHTFGKMQITDYLDDCPYILRPHNLGARVPGRGYGVFDCGRARIAVMNLIGRCDLAFHADNPFKTADELLKSGEKPTFTPVRNSTRIWFFRAKPMMFSINLCIVICLLIRCRRAVGSWLRPLRRRSGRPKHR